MKRNVVLTFASGYPLATVEVFFASWAEHASPSSELVVFGGGNDDAFHEAAARLGICVLDPSGLPNLPLLVARNFVFRDFLTTYRRNFDNVLVSDARDVFFQSDPFAVSREGLVTFATEDRTIEACDYNRYWMHMVYGSEIRRALSNEIICCAGTTIGSIEGILRWLDLMCVEAGLRRADCGEQCHHNYIAYVAGPDFIDIDVDDRVVQTIGYTERDRLRFVEGRLLVDNVAAPVVHQYDRHADLVGRIRERHRLPS